MTGSLRCTAEIDATVQINYDKKQFLRQKEKKNYHFTFMGEETKPQRGQS